MSIFASFYTSQKTQLDQWINMLCRHIATVHKVAHSRTTPIPLMADGFDVLPGKNA
ncbi:pectate disaccharide-lyase|uniref:Uncharacterized protein n=1 Tax=Brenneria salicis ATCC 15712 = DSM 30166 TaxID=714314 RepID=A0A366I4G2_9GAMM|nr:hypothetical protein [Brenneria salicis]NMN91547.1 pectate disaccharide-lyase [Brenneria salicis ATCC 15712 = DSM 30166]RBP63017.1 hypothetical protein DES54_11331 [Brenneria salicis ATCC 15712 = DSM 30166]